MSDRYDLVLDSGADATRLFVIVDSCGNPLNLTDYTARMQIRPTRSSDQVLDECTTENGRLKFVDGGLLLEMTDEATDNLHVSHAVYDIEIISPEGRVTRLVEGRVITRQGVTR